MWRQFAKHLVSENLIEVVGSQTKYRIKQMEHKSFVSADYIVALVPRASVATVMSNSGSRNVEV